MIGAIFFAIAVFIGWFIFDFVQNKKIIIENVISAFITAIVAGIVWYILFLVF